MIPAQKYDIDWDYDGDYGLIILHSVKLDGEEMLEDLTRYELDQIKSHCMAKQKEIWSEQR
jgi:hypothetical protein